jgi:hypothetical protein
MSGSDAMLMVTDPECQTHVVFDELDRFIAFYEQLADSVFARPLQGTKAFCNIDSYVFSSIQGTLTSIQAILRDGRINDAYALLRKYQDSAVINIYSNLYLTDHFSVENLVVEQIDNWLKGITQIPEFRIMSQYIRSSPKVEPITALLSADDRYKRLRSRANDHTHYNFYHNVLLNDNAIALSTRRKALDVFSKDVRDVFLFHVAYVFFINEHYMASSDFIDALDCGMTPEPDSQYWVAPFVQDVFDQTVHKHRPDIAVAIKRHTTMHLA